MAQSRVSEHDLLFGQLAVSTGFVTEDQLRQVKTVLNSGQFSSLGAALVDGGLLTDAQKAGIEHLLHLHLEMHDGDARLSLASLPPTVSLRDCDTDATHDFPRTAISRTAASAGDFAGYELLDELGKGGMGIVYKARQTKLNRTVALKMIKAGELADEHEIERFKGEAEAAASLDHPGIVPVYEVGESKSQHFFSMGFVDGDTLGDRLREGPLEPRYAAELVKQISDAVAYAHSQQIIHRDLKPGNILLDADGHPRITDFGLAKQMSADTEITATGQVLGTPSYMPPEQASGSETGTAADIYALGAILYATTTGKPPHQAASPTETLLAVLHKDPAAPRVINDRIPKDLETICLRCLNKDPAKRYPSAEELAEDLGCWLENKPIAARRVGRVEKTWLWCKRRPLVASLLLILVAGAMAAGLTVWERQNAARAETLVESLVKSDVEQIPALLREVEEYSWWAGPRLRARFERATEGSLEKLHLRLALLRDDAVHVHELRERMLNLSDMQIGYVSVIRQALYAHRTEIEDDLWESFHDQSAKDRVRFHAGIALTKYRPELVRKESEHEGWTDSDYQFLVEQLVSSNPLHQPELLDLLDGIRDKLITPLHAVFVDATRSESEQIAATNALASYGSDDSERLGTWLSQTGTPKQYDILFGAFRETSTKDALGSLASISAKQPAKGLSQNDRIALGKQRAGAAITLLRLGQRESVFHVSQVNDDPEALTQFIHRCRDRGVTPTQLLECLEQAEQLRNVADGQQGRSAERIMFAILLALGEFTTDEVPDARLLIDRLVQWYANDPSSAIHGASGWLLRHWGNGDLITRIDQTPTFDHLPTMDELQDREWFVLEFEGKARPLSGQSPFKIHFTFVLFRPGEFQMGSPDDEIDRENDEELHTVRITRPLAVSERELTWSQWTAMEGKGRLEAYQRQFQTSIKPLDPAFGSNWFESAAYCRWLSQQAGLSLADQCYGDPNSLPKGADGNPRDWPVNLDKRGFRLMTEAEWEYVCRGGMRTAYNFGGDVQLLDKYAWFAENSAKSSHTVGQLRPSLRGLFDLHGNVFEWCHDVYGSETENGAVDPIGPLVGLDRVYRGSSWSSSSRDCRAAARNGIRPVGRGIFLGIRLAFRPAGGTREPDL